jgi:outer membrane protein insertion porin family
MPRVLYTRLPFIAVCGILLALLTGCNIARYLGDEELLLTKNDIIFTNAKDVKNKGNLKYELSTLYKQSPNTNWLFLIPREWLHYRSLAKEKKTKFDAFKGKRAELPAIFRDTLALATENQMTYYLNYLGYFQAEVTHEAIPAGNKKVRTRYYVDPGQLVLVDTIHFHSPDTVVHQVLQEISSETLFKRGAPLEGRLFDGEKDRITRHLRNSGFAYFYANSIASLEVDTMRSQQKASVYLTVNSPYDAPQHQQYRIGKITIFSQFDPAKPENAAFDTLVGDYLFKRQQPAFLVKPQTIINGIYLKSGDLYSQADYDLTLQNLSSLGVFRFVRIRLDAQPDRPEVLDLRLELTPIEKYELGVDVEFNYIDGTTLTGRGSLIGLSVLPSARNRNLFKGAELNVTNLNTGVEINLSQINTEAFWNSVELGLQNDLFFPKFVDYLGFWRRLHRLQFRDKPLFSDDYLQTIQNKTATRLTARYSYIFNFGFYETSILNASFGYDLPFSSTKRYVLDHTGIDFLRPITQPAFDVILAANPFLSRSFGNQLFVSLLFRSFNLVHNIKPNRRGESGYLGMRMELAGAEVWAGNALYNALSSQKDTLRLANADFSQFARIEGDVRFYREFNPKTTFASRFSIGLAQPFGFTSDVPYVKQFFVGGPNSIRGWAARGLGPGGYIDTLSGSLTNRLLFYQTGDLRLEWNAELRFPMFSRLRGALFIDAGNVWTLRADPDRCGAQFLWRSRFSADCSGSNGRNEAFYRQIALGSGMGFRLDFTYFIFRLDVGVRLRNPYPIRNHMDPKPRERDYWENFSSWGMRDLNFNFGLGYPF